MVREEVNLTTSLGAKLLEVSRRSGDYPAAMGEVLDILDQAGWSISEAASRLGVSTGRLIRFLRTDVQLWTEVNRKRQMAGLRGLN